MKNWSDSGGYVAEFRQPYLGQTAFAIWDYLLYLWTVASALKCFRLLAKKSTGETSLDSQKEATSLLTSDIFMGF